MTLSPQKLREAVFLFLYSLDFSDQEDQTPDLVMEELKITRKNAETARQKAAYIYSQSSDLDVLISKYSSAYDFHRIPRAEKNILRLAFFELVMEKTLHYKVIISEAIRLTRKFASREAGAFINALLDHYVKEFNLHDHADSSKNTDASSS